MNKSIRLALALSVILVSCATPSGASDETMPNAGLKIDLVGMSRAHQFRGAVLGSQPNAVALKTAHAQYGVKTVINLRQSGEFKYFREEDAVHDFGMNYVHIPFKMAPTLTDDVFEKARGILRDKSNQPILMHCKSGNRVGAIWYAYLVLDLGVSPDDAMVEAKIVGLGKPGHISRAQGYVSSFQK